MICCLERPLHPHCGGLTAVQQLVHVKLRWKRPKLVVEAVSYAVEVTFLVVALKCRQSKVDLEKDVGRQSQSQNVWGIFEVYLISNGAAGCVDVVSAL